VTKLYNRMVLNRKRLSQLTHARDVESTIDQDALTGDESRLVRT
jgi:hypothetical protein